MHAERLTGVVSGHGEGPAWDPHAGVVRIVDMLAGDVVTLGDQVTRLAVGQVAAAWRPRRDGGLVVATERGFTLVSASGAVGEEIPAFDDPSLRMNDGGCDPQGRFYCGSMAYDARSGAGSLYRLDGDLSVRRVLSGVTISNGLAWDVEGSCAYYVDTPTGRIDRLRFGDDGAVSERTPQVVIDPAHGSPDGITVDAEGGIWVALWGGGAVHRYSPDGALTAVVEVDARQVTACTFGGPDLDTLYITTSRHGHTNFDDAAAGSVFVAQPGVRGLVPHLFAA